MDFRILGPLAAMDGDVDVPVPGVKLRTLLALLLVRPGETIAAERLADDLWGEATPTGAANALQSLVSKLRRTLGESGRLLVTTANGYRFDVSPASIDAVRFAEAAQHGRQALINGDAAEASTLLRPALAMWTGAALDGLRDEGVLHREATRLDELRMSALEDCVDADLRLGRHAELIAELGSLTTTYPLRERLHGFLMLALYRAGRQGEALRAFQVAREVLADELGLDPGPELRTLETAILEQDPALDLDLPSARTPKRRRTNLAKGLSTFIGRVDDVVALTQTVANGRLVTVVGPGGAGKTRLAVEVASGSVDAMDVWFVDLAPLRSADEVADTVASTIGIADGLGAMSGQHPDRTIVDRIAEHIDDQQVLVLLDNCEHVIPEAARVAERLLMMCSGLTIVATSREALGVRGETIWPVPPMSTDDAVALFADRATAASAFSITADNTQTVTDLCQRLDGMPLAIELAAGRVRVIPVHQLAARLDDRFRILTGGARTALPRQQTLRAVVEWSYELLFDDEQRVFERLSVFSGGCSLEAAEAVCSGDGIAVEDIADLLFHLVDKSLIVADHSGPEVRFRLLQTLALYGRERLAASEGADRVRARHSAYFQDLCRRGHDAFHGVDQVKWLTEVENDADNLRAALSWTIDQRDALTAQTMMGGLGWSWWFAGRGDEGYRLLTAALNCPGESTPVARASTAMWAAYVGFSAGAGMIPAAAHGDEAVELLYSAPGQSVGDITCERLLPDALVLQAGVYAWMGRHDEARALFQDAHELYAAGDDPWCKAFTTYTAALIAEMGGDLQRSFDLQSEAIEYYEAAHVDWAMAVINGDVGVLAVRLGLLDVAIARAQRARRSAQLLRLGGYESLLLSRLGEYALERGNIDEADQFMTESIDLSEAVHYVSAQAYAYSGRAMVRRAQGRFDESIEAARRSIKLHEATGMLQGTAQALSTMGFVAQQRGDAATARSLHTQALDAARRTNTARAIAVALEGLAGAALLEGDAVRSAQLLGAAHAVRQADGGGEPGPASDAPNIRRTVIAQLGTDSYEASAAAGAAADLDALTDLASTAQAPEV